VRTRHLSLVTQEHSVTIKTKSDVLSPYGPVRAGLTTSQTTQEAQLSELLNSLENVVESLNYKSFTVYDTLTHAIQGVRVALSAIVTDEAGIDITCDECGGDLVAEGESKCLECLESSV
jgi:hypothetical protein